MYATLTRTVLIVAFALRTTRWFQVKKTEVECHAEQQQRQAVLPLLGILSLDWDFLAVVINQAGEFGFLGIFWGILAVLSV